LKDFAYLFLPLYIFIIIYLCFWLMLVVKSFDAFICSELHISMMLAFECFCLGFGPFQNQFPSKYHNQLLSRRWRSIYFGSSPKYAEPEEPHSNAFYVTSGLHFHNLMLLNWILLAGRDKEPFEGESSAS